MSEEERAILADLFYVTKNTLQILSRYMDGREGDADDLAEQILIIKDVEKSVEETLLK